jgi:hypothetical protein
MVDEPMRMPALRHPHPKTNPAQTGWELLQLGYAMPSAAVLTQKRTCSPIAGMLLFTVCLYYLETGLGGHQPRPARPRNETESYPPPIEAPSLLRLA